MTVSPAMIKTATDMMIFVAKGGRCRIGSHGVAEYAVVKVMRMQGHAAETIRDRDIVLLRCVGGTPSRTNRTVSASCHGLMRRISLPHEVDASRSPGDGLAHSEDQTLGQTAT
jgi:hypothetical protein